MNVLVTGCAGFIGSHIVDVLVGEHEVTIYDNFEPQVHKQEPDYLNKDAEINRADMHDMGSLKSVVMDVNIIPHQVVKEVSGQKFLLPGCYSHSETIEKTMWNMNEAIEAHLPALKEDGEEVPNEEEFVIGRVKLSAVGQRSFGMFDSDD